jgi:hypothetical protein
MMIGSRVVDVDEQAQTFEGEGVTANALSCSGDQNHWNWPNVMN